MKKFLSLFLALPMLAFVASCDDDDSKVPDVSVSIEYSGGTLTDGVLTVVEGDTLKIEGLKVTPAPGTGEAVLGFYVLRTHLPVAQGKITADGGHDNAVFQGHRLHCQRRKQGFVIVHRQTNPSIYSISKNRLAL